MGHFGEVFAQILSAVCKTQHLRKHGFTKGISTVLTVAAGPGSIQGEKNTHAEAMLVLWSRNKLRKHFGMILGSRGEPDVAPFLTKCFFFFEFPFSFRLSLGVGSAAEAGSLLLKNSAAGSRPTRLQVEGPVAERRMKLRNK